MTNKTKDITERITEVKYRASFTNHMKLRTRPLTGLMNGDLSYTFHKGISNVESLYGRVTKILQGFEGDIELILTNSDGLDSKISGRLYCLENSPPFLGVYLERVAQIEKIAQNYAKKNQNRG